jgi:hypothetical protein
MVRKYIVGVVLTLGYSICTQEAERKYADRHGSIGSPLPCHCWESDRAVSNVLISVNHCRLYMAALLYYKLMFFFPQLTKEKNVFIQKYCTVRSSGLRGMNMHVTAALIGLLFIFFGI